MRLFIRTILAVIITLAVFFSSMIIPMATRISIPYIPSTFWLHSSMILLTLVCGAMLKRRGIRLFPNAEIPVLLTLKAIGTSIVWSMGASMFFMVVTVILGVRSEGGNEHFVFQTMHSLQIMIFVVIWASIAEEMLTRGLLQTLLEPVRKWGIPFLKTRLSMPVLISGIVFGFLHFGLVKTGASPLFVAQIIISTTVLGWCAGYYREKYNSIGIAVLIHAGFNFLGLCVFLLSTLVK